MIKSTSEFLHAVSNQSTFPDKFRRSADLRLWHALEPKRLTESSIDLKSFTRIKNAVESSSDLGWASSELASKAQGWGEAYQLNPVRTAIAQPLTINKGHSILEIGAGCGILTRFFAEKAGRVVAIEKNTQQAQIAAMRTHELGNVDVVACDLQDFCCHEKFDIVTLIGVLEGSFDHVAGENNFKAVLEIARSYLSCEGVLVLAIDNKLALKYFSGARVDKSSRVFEGIEGYPSGAPSGTLGKVELQQSLETAGFEHTKFLYPFPDYKFPSVIMAPDGIKAASEEPYLYQWLSYRNASDYTNSVAYQLFRERLVAKQLETNKLLTQMANSFLVVAAQSSEHVAKFIDSQSLIYKYGLGRNDSFMTEVVLKQTPVGPAVAKRKLCPGVEPRQSSADNCLGLRIQTEQQIRPYKQGVTLMEKITTAFVKTDGDADPDHILLPLLEQWNRFLQEAALPSTDEDLLLPGLYWDCIPENLMTVEDGSLFYFDQEYEFYQLLPRKYILFRGFMYLYQNGLAFIEQSYAKKKLSDRSFRCFLEHMFKLLQLQISDIEYDNFWQIEWRCMKSVLLVFDIDLPFFKSLYSSSDPNSIIRTLPWFEDRLVQASEELAAQRDLYEDQLKILQAQLQHAGEEIANSVETVNFLSSTMNNMQQSKFWQLRSFVQKIRGFLHL